MPSARAAALMRMIHRPRKSRLRTLRERYMCIQACCTASLAAAWQLERLPRKPLAALSTRLRRRRALNPRLARGMGQSLYGRSTSIWWWCAGGTYPAWRSWRFRFCLRPVSRCRLNTRWNLNLPVAVRLKRFLAPEWVLTLGMATSAERGCVLCPTGRRETSPFGAFLHRERPLAVKLGVPIDLVPLPPTTTHSRSAPDRQISSPCTDFGRRLTPWRPARRLPRPRRPRRRG